MHVVLADQRGLNFARAGWIDGLLPVFLLRDLLGALFGVRACCCMGGGTLAGGVWSGVRLGFLRWLRRTLSRLLGRSRGLRLCNCQPSQGQAENAAKADPLPPPNLSRRLHVRNVNLSPVRQPYNHWRRLSCAQLGRAMAPVPTRASHNFFPTKSRRNWLTLSSPKSGWSASLAGFDYWLRKCTRQENRSILRP